MRELGHNFAQSDIVTSCKRIEFGAIHKELCNDLNRFRNALKVWVNVRIAVGCLILLCELHFGF